MPRVLLSSFVALALASIIACGGSESDAVAAGGAETLTSAARKGGGSTPSNPTPLSVAPLSADRNGNVTFTLHPGSYANQQLFIRWQCFQDGRMVAYDGSFDLAAAVAQGLPGYAFVGDHYEWTFIISQASNYLMTAGPASCNATAWYENRRMQWFQFATATFDVQ